jgi:hypothetical protein
MIAIVAAVCAGAVSIGTSFAAEDPPRGRIQDVCQVVSYTARPGQAAALHAWFREHAEDVLARHGAVPMAFLVPADPGPENEGRLLVILRFRDDAALIAFSRTVREEPAWKELFAVVDGEPAIVANKDMRLGAPTDYSPVFKPTKADPPRVFELRTYTAPTPEKLDHLHERFRSHTLELFARHGIENLVYWQPLIWKADDTEAERQMFYLLGHQSRAAAAESFAAFRADPEWLAVRKASEAKAGGSLTSPEKGVVSEFFVPTDYSPLR